MKLIPLSYELSKSTPSYGNKHKVTVKQIEKISKGNTSNSYEMKIYNHIGTHVDCPNHFYDNGKKIDQYNIDDFIFKSPQLIDVTLKENHMISKQTITKELNKETDIDKNKRNINSLLNKISKNNFDVIFKKIICNLKDDKDELFEFIIKNIFEKSIIQPFYCPCYVKLYLELINFNNIFKDMIINICSEYFDMIKYYKKMLNENIKDTNYDTFCLIIKNKNKKKGFSQFIGELYLNNIIELDAINKIISILINNINKIITENEFDIIENNILCLTVLLNTIHKDINKLDNIDKYLKTIEGFSKNKKIMKRLQFKLMDLLDNIKN